MYYGIKSLIDVRADAMPSDYPEYDREHLYQHCEQHKIVYHWAGRQLGNSINGSKRSHHCALDDVILRSYADYMTSHKFQIAATQIINMAQQGTIAIFSQNALPLIDFRFLLADYLLLQGIQIIHILAVDELRDHLLHKNARRESTELIYDNLD
ncbi:hypothetical protein MNBD_GAMMA22-2644 [hydrothermal vent metagenome]|uniref:Uncharacterized protein n=1 Tax=hydrothermal vent metagenome TaxID=652676 RepID=A0A3B0ZHK2_9ZZZZ